MPSELLTALAVQARGEKWRLISKTEICTASCGKTELYINAWKIFRDLKVLFGQLLALLHQMVSGDSVAGKLFQGKSLCIGFLLDTYGCWEFV
jgi:hypothetical protein